MESDEVRAPQGASRQSLCAGIRFIKSLEIELDEPVDDTQTLSARSEGTLEGCEDTQRLSASGFAAQQKFIPILFHNLTNYDVHLFITNLYYDKGKITAIANNEEKYVSFSKYIDEKEFRFLDSFRFLNKSIDVLSSGLTHEQLKQTRKYFTDEQLKVLFREKSLKGDGKTKILRKGIYPYEYMDSFERFNETSLPPIKEFRSSLNDTTIKEDEYEHALKVWDYFKIKNLGEWHDLYLKLDVLLLSDVFEAFRDKALATYGLDPAWYYTLPSFGWDCMLKYTKAEIELITDHNMYMMFERSIRGGICQASNRYSKAGLQPDGSFKENYYWDITNEYGWAMIQPLPIRDFKELSHCPEWDINPHQWFEEWLQREYYSYCPSGTDQRMLYTGRGITLDIDIASFPEELHDWFNDLPLAPENIDPRVFRSEAPKTKGVKKLICHFNAKKNYVIYYRLLDFFVKEEMIISKIISVVEYTEETFIKSYIDYNTEQRKNAKNDFEKDFWKMMCNSVYGNCIENARNRSSIEF